MSTDCENLLRKFLVLNPAKRASLETIMRDKWMNMGYEDDELKPFIEPQADLKDPKRIGKTGTVFHLSNNTLYQWRKNCATVFSFTLLCVSFPFREGVFHFNPHIIVALCVCFNYSTNFSLNIFFIFVF